jgi:adenylate cyclase
MSSAAVKTRSGGLSLREAADRIGVAATTLRRWTRDGLIPPYDGNWSPAAVSHARIVARLRERGHSLEDIRQASDEGRLAFGYVEALFDTGEEVYSLQEASRETGLEPALIARVVAALGTSPAHPDRISAEDLRLMRYGTTGLETADEMFELTRRLLPMSSPVMDHVHQRYLQHFVEQDVVGHMESDLDDARVIKTIGDEVMAVGSEPVALTEWAVGFQRLGAERTLPRIAVHYGNALYRDGDYYERDVNIASRVAARAGGGEVLVTRPVVERARGDLEFDRIADVRLKGFTESTEVFIARERNGSHPPR